MRTIISQSGKLKYNISTCEQVVEVGYGVAAAITWISERGFPNCSWMRRRQGRTPGLLSTCTITQLDGRQVISHHQY